MPKKTKEKTAERGQKTLIAPGTLVEALRDAMRANGWHEVRGEWLDAPTARTLAVLGRAARDLELHVAHRWSARHRAILAASRKCGCFHCLKTFLPSKVVEWTDGGTTAICPHCGIDAVLGDASGLPIDKGFLREMAGRWFARVPAKDT